MPNFENIRDETPLSDQATLRMLSVLEEGDSVSQRELSLRIGVALGLTNKLIKRGVRKGLLKVSEAPAKRYVYYLTPKGFAEKSRLVGEYLSTSLNFFRQARVECEKKYRLMKRNGHQKIALYCISELAEIAVLAAQADDVALQMIVQPDATQTTFSGLMVVSSLEEAKAQGVDAILICCSGNPQKAYYSVCGIYDDEQIYAASFLHISRKEIRFEEDEIL